MRPGLGFGLKRCLGRPGGSVSSLAWNSSGSLLAVRDKCSLEVWRVSFPSIEPAVHAELVCSRTADRGRALAWHPQHELVVVAQQARVELLGITENSTKVVWETETEQRTSTVAAWSADGCVLAVALENMLLVWSWPLAPAVLDGAPLHQWAQRLDGLPR